MESMECMYGKVSRNERFYGIYRNTQIIGNNGNVFSKRNKQFCTHILRQRLLKRTLMKKIKYKPFKQGDTSVATKQCGGCLDFHYVKDTQLLHTLTYIQSFFLIKVIFKLEFYLLLKPR